MTCYQVTRPHTKNEKFLLKHLFIKFLAGRWLYSTALPCSDYVQSLKPFYYQRKKIQISVCLGNAYFQSYKNCPETDNVVNTEII